MADRHTLHVEGRVFDITPNSLSERPLTVWVAEGSQLRCLGTFRNRTEALEAIYHEVYP